MRLREYLPYFTSLAQFKFINLPTVIEILGRGNRVAVLKLRVGRCGRDHLDHKSISRQLIGTDRTPYSLT